MALERLHVYQQADQAVVDLRAGHIDLVLMDALPAEVAAQSYGLEIVAQGLNRQILAIAVPNGEEQLRSEINRALTSLRNACA